MLIATANMLISNIRGEEFDLLCASILLSLHNNVLHLTPEMLEMEENVNFLVQDLLVGKKNLAS